MYYFLLGWFKNVFGRYFFFFFFFRLGFSKFSTLCHPTRKQVFLKRSVFFFFFSPLHCSINLAVEVFSSLLVSPQ